jgi:hypothetical protein
MNLVDSDTTSTFTTQELERLGAYRAAVAAGFYTDWDGSAESTDSELLAWLSPAETAEASYPFTPDERTRLVRARAAVAAGYYSDEVASAGEQKRNAE